MATKKAILISCITLLILLFAGCGTIISQNVSSRVFLETNKYGKYDRDQDCSYPTPQIFSGVVSDIQLLTFPFSCLCSGEGGLGFLIFWPIFLPLSIIDLPLSAVADTLILPYSIPRQMEYGNITEACEN